MVATRSLPHLSNGASEASLVNEMSAEIMEITPDIAGDWLSRPSTNRRINPRTVRQYAAAMERGEWALNGEAIKFDTRGRLVDGQHRCIAVVQSGVTIQSLVVSGVAPVAFDSMDSGLRRAPNDVLDIHGYVNTATLAAAIRNVLTYDWYGDFANRPDRITPSKQQILLAANEWPAMHESVRVSQWHGIRAFRASNALFAALHFIFSNIDPEDASAFFERLREGTGLTTGDPILVLRERLFANAAAKSRLTSNELAGIIIKAWNAYREGRRVKVLTWRSGGASPEPFPTIK